MIVDKLIKLTGEYSVIGRSMMVHSTVKGTPAFMAPELFKLGDDPLRRVLMRLRMRRHGVGGVVRNDLREVGEDALAVRFQGVVADAHAPRLPPGFGRKSTVFSASEAVLHSGRASAKNGVWHSDSWSANELESG